MPLGTLEILALGAFLGLLGGFAGGVGGRRWAMAAVKREFEILAADFEAFGERLKRVEGRAAQDKRRGQGGPLDGLTPEFLQLLASGAAGPKKPMALVSQAPTPRTFPPHDGNATPCLCRDCTETYETDAAAVRKFSRG